MKKTAIWRQDILQDRTVMNGVKGSNSSLEHKMSEGGASVDALQQQLQESQRALKRTREHLTLQETRSRQLVNACAAKLREKQAENERMMQLKDRQFQRILQQLVVLQSKMKREQKLITSRMQEQDQLSQQQARELERLRKQNRRLISKVNRLSEPCSQCGAKPDSGISDCDDADESRSKVMKLQTTDSQSPSADAAVEAAGSGTDSPKHNCDSSQSASPPTAERGIMKTSSRSTAQKTVTFSLQDKENRPEAQRPARVRLLRADPPAGKKPPPVRHRPPIPLKPRIIIPPSININGTTYGQPSIVDTISQLLGADLETPAVRRPLLSSKKLSVIPEGADEQEQETGSEHEYENVRVETLGGDADSEQEQQDEVVVVSGEVNVRSGLTVREVMDNDSVNSNNYRNVPRSRSNINLIMSEREGVQIKDNFEEFKFEDDMASSVCSDSASDRSGDNGNEEKRSLDRRAGDGAESEQIDDNKTVVLLNGNYDKFLEQSGLSQKTIRTPSRMFNNHRSMMKPKDVKHRHRVKTSFGGFSIEDMSPTSVRYYSEQL